MLLRRFKIVGHSMSPAFPENCNVLASSLPFLFANPKTGDVVVINKSGRVYIKRIKEIKEGKYFLLGDNKSDSLDSKSFGLVNRNQILGKVIIKL